MTQKRMVGISLISLGVETRPLFNTSTILSHYDSLTISHQKHIVQQYIPSLLFNNNPYLVVQQYIPISLFSNIFLHNSSPILNPYLFVHQHIPT